MKAGILFGDRDIRVGDAEDPRPGPGEVLVRNEAAGICGTDLHIYRGEFHGRVAFPAIQGHEFGGIVEEVGRGVEHISRGDRVVVDPLLPCQACTPCLTGHFNACRALKLLGVDVAGGYGQFVAAPAARVYTFPDSVPMRFAPMVEMFGLACHILDRGRVQPGESVAILGAGKLGLSVLDVLCHAASAGPTFVTDLQPFRLAAAEHLGADCAINVNDDDPVARVFDLTRGEGVDCVIECVGHYHDVAGRDAPLQQAVRMIRPGGRIVTCGLGDQLSPVHYKTLVLKEAEIIASRVTRGEFPRAIRLMARGLLHPDRHVTHRMAMRDIAAAFAQVDREDPATIKIVLDVQEV